MIAGLVIGITITILAGISAGGWTAVFLEDKADKIRGRG